MTLAIASYQVAMSRKDLSDDAKKRLSEDFAALSEELGKPRWATNPGPQAAAYVNEASELFFGGSAGPGKAQALTAKALTPKGWVQIGDIKVGQMVSDPTTGGACKVLQIHPQGVKPMYRIICDDDATCEATIDHLWAFKRPRTIKPRKKRSAQREQVREIFGACKPDRSKWNHHRIGSTADLMAHLANGERPRIPLSEPLLFDVNGRTGTGRADPYVVGVLLGDGNIKSLSICSCDDEIRGYLMASKFRPSGEKMHTDGKEMNYIPETPKVREIYRNWVNNNGLRGCLSDTKFLPGYIFTAPFMYRLSILQGLMDTDGTVSDDGEVYYCSTSRRLADDVRNLIRSLGGKASITSKNPFYRTSEGHKVYCREAYTLYINMPKDSAIFRLTRKKARCTDSWNGGHDNMRSVERIEYVGEKEAQCITVNSPFGLYVTDDYIVTHNSALLLGLALTAHEKSLILRREGTNLAELIDMITKWALPEEKGGWKSIGNGGRFRTHDGRTIELHGCEDEKEMKKFAGRPHGLKAWDELPQHSKNIYDYVNAWNRSTDTFERKRIVGAGNPPMAPEEEWVLKHWGPWLDPQHPSYPMPPGELCWFSNVDGKEEQFPDGKPVTRENRGRTEVITPTSRTFIPALLEDNPDLDQSGYRARLQGLREPMRSRMLYGDMRAVTDDNEHQLIKSDWIRLSMDRWSRSEITKARREGRPLGIRLDVAALDVAIRGEDNCCLAKKFGVWVDALRVWPGAKFSTGKDVADTVVHHLTEYDLAFNQVPLLIDTLAEPGGRTVEAFGLSYPNFQAIPINFGASSRYVAKAGRVRTLNVRAEAYWKLSELLDPTAGPPETRLMLPDDPDLFKDLCAIRYKDGGSTIQMESKKEIKKRIGRSTDRADAVAMLTLKSRNSGWLPPTETDHRGGGQTDLTRRQVSQFMGADLGSRIW